MTPAQTPSLRQSHSSRPEPRHRWIDAMTGGINTESLIERLVGKGDPYAALGARRWLESAALEDIALGSRRQQLIVAAMPFAPADLLRKLSVEADAALALRLAKNPATPGEVLTRLMSGAPAQRIRRYIASHRHELG